MVKQAQRLLRKDLQACPGTAVKTRYNNNDDDSNDVKHDFFFSMLNSPASRSPSGNSQVRLTNYKTGK